MFDFDVEPYLNYEGDERYRITIKNNVRPITFTLNHEEIMILIQRLTDASEANLYDILIDSDK